MAHFSGAFFQRTVNTEEVVDFLGKYGARSGDLVSYSQLMLHGVCDSRQGGKGQLVFSTVEQFTDSLGLKESLVLIDELPELSEMGTNQFIRVADPRAAFIDLLDWLIGYVGLDAHRPGFNETAAVSAQANISPHAIIEPGVEIGEGTTVCAGAVIKNGTRIASNTVIRENVIIGCDGVTVYRAEDDRLLKFPHVAGVSIGSNTEIGANAVIAGGILAPTTIGDDVVVGNLCNIGHGAAVRQGVWVSVGSLIGGHTTINSGATIAMGVSVRDNLVVGEGASIGMGSVVVKPVEANHSMFGNPAKRMANLKTGPKR